MGLMGVISKLSSVICHESGHNISLSCNNMPLCGNNMPLLNDYGWLLFTQKVHKKIAKPHFAPSGRRTVPFVYFLTKKVAKIFGYFKNYS